MEGTGEKVRRLQKTGREKGDRGSRASIPLVCPPKTYTSAPSLFSRLHALQGTYSQKSPSVTTQDTSRILGISWQADAPWVYALKIFKQIVDMELIQLWQGAVSYCGGRNRVELPIEVFLSLEHMVMDK